MAQSGEFDPVKAWQQMVSQWERQVNDLSAKLSANEHFAGTMNQASKISLAARQSFEGGMEKLLQSMQLSTAAQMSAVTERLDRIEETLARIEAGSSPSRGDSAEPKRTRKPGA